MRESKESGSGKERAGQGNTARVASSVQRGTLHLLARGKALSQSTDSSARLPKRVRSAALAPRL
jgi:hypothetical protein